MDIRALFGLSVLMSFIAFGIVTRFYIWPQLRVMNSREALIPLVVVHTFRFVGLSFLIPGVVSPLLPSGFAIPAAYGDLLAAILAMVSTLALSERLGRSRWCGLSMCRAQPISCTRFTRARYIFELALGHWAPRFSSRR
jgi:hypothetical protein